MAKLQNVVTVGTVNRSIKLFCAVNHNVSQDICRKFSSDNLANAALEGSERNGENAAHAKAANGKITIQLTNAHMRDHPAIEPQVPSLISCGR
jgi:hypothetical protein